MKQQLLRKPTVKTAAEIKKQRERQLQAITSSIPKEHLETINKFLRNAERGRLEMVNDGADVTRQITADQVAKFLACKDCQAKPYVFIPCSKQLVAPLDKDLKKKLEGNCCGVCRRHWEGMADTVIGWSEERC